MTTMTTKAITEIHEQLDAEPAERWNKIYHYDSLAEGLYDLLADAEEVGMTIGEIAQGLDIPVHVARKVIRFMRKVFAEDYDVNLIWRVDGRDRRYLLTRNVEIAGVRLDSRLRSFASNFETELMLLASLANGLDRSTKDGQDVHYLIKVMQRLHEDVDEMLDRRDNRVDV